MCVNMPEPPVRGGEGSVCVNMPEPPVRGGEGVCEHVQLHKCSLPIIIFLFPFPDVVICRPSYCQCTSYSSA